jgi:hypothetical protein
MMLPATPTTRKGCGIKTVSGVGGVLHGKRFERISTPNMAGPRYEVRRIVWLDLVTIANVIHAHVMKTNMMEM